MSQVPRADRKAKPEFDNHLPVNPDRIQAIIDRAGTDKRVQILAEIAHLSNHRFSIPEIALALGEYHRTTVRTFGDAHSKRAVKKACAQGTMNLIVAAMELTEVFVMEAVSLKIRAMAGKLKTTPEQMGTLQRAIENALDTCKVFSGKTVDDLLPLAGDLTVPVPKKNDPAVPVAGGLTQAQKNIEEIKRREREAQDKVNGSAEEEPEPIE